ncbi:DNA cytosine methyltransferase [Fulvitalea axinellae]|uniref:DNA cytosine methyltransferase n=1 Tax=Fulvitalea axinellae TaxID=1182444 RepID=UPI0030CA29B6
MGFIEGEWKVGDMFCGAGGTSTGAMNVPGVKVSWCINHDSMAIKSHKENHPDCDHYNEDIVDMDISILSKVHILWASLECTHFSNAKGGQSRDADSRMLAEQMYRYAEHCQPAYIMIENVREFLTWGPLTQKKDKKGDLVYKTDGTPHMIPDTDPNKLGSYYRQWVCKLKSMGYVNYSYKLLNSADFGAYTKRIRYFGVFSKSGYPIRFPSQTHTERLAVGYSQWKPVRECLDFRDRGRSIFGRKRKLSENTLKRIFAGIQKFGPEGRTNSFLAKYYGNGENLESVEGPAGTITTKDRFAFISKYFSGHPSSKNKSIDSPLGTITCIDHHAKVEFLANPQQFGSVGSKLDEPHPTIVASKRYTSLVSESGDPVSLGHDDSEMERKIKLYMIKHGITDILMRMLKVDELLKIQGFPPGYKLLGTQEKQKKYIGNSVVPAVAEKLINANVNQEFFKALRKAS